MTLTFSLLSQRMPKNQKIMTPDEFDHLLLTRLQSLQDHEAFINAIMEDDELSEEVINDEADDEGAFNAFNDSEIDLFENITSCGKMENCVMLSEFEQNLQLNPDSTASAPANFSMKKIPHQGKRKKKWSIFGGSKKKIDSIQENSF